MYRKQVRRRRAILVVLVVACLVLISTQFSESNSGPLHVAQNGVGSVTAPLEDGASRALKPFKDLVNWFGETFDARGENDRLKAEVADLRQKLADEDAKLEEGIQRGKIAKITADSALAGFTQVEARVIARSVSSWNQTLAISAGSGDGVAVNDPVITGGGLVGKVTSVTGNSSRVALLTDQETEVAARVLEGGPVGIVGASVGDSSDLVLSLIQDDQDVKAGAEVVTSGFSDSSLGVKSLFPPNIPIGRVKSSGESQQELNQQVHIEPYVDFDDISYVTVLSGGGG